MQYEESSTVSFKKKKIISKLKHAYKKTFA